MLSARTPLLIFVLICIAVFPELANGQSNAGSSPENAKQTFEDPVFSVIQNSLTRAADNALSATNMQSQEVKPISFESNGPFQTESPKTVPAAQKKIERVDAMRDLVRPILAQEGVPAELFAVAQIESSGNPFALSPKGARGLWQLMPETARRYGLRVDSSNDERVDIEKSTTVAARYLRDLHAQFGSWPLALAAYNTGELNLQRAISRAGSNEFAELSFLGLLPIETRHYVPAVLAAMNAPRAIDGAGSPGVASKTFVFAKSVPDDTRRAPENGYQP